MNWLDLLADRLANLESMQPPVSWAAFEPWVKGVRPIFVERLEKHLDEFDKLTSRPKTPMLPRSAPMCPSRTFEGALGQSEMDRYHRRKSESDGDNARAAALERKWFQGSVDTAHRNTVEFVRGILAAMQDESAPPDLSSSSSTARGRVFLGHGRSKQWQLLASFLKHGLDLETEEFNSGESAAGKFNSQHVDDLIANCDFAFLVYTAEDPQADGSMRARENVVEETGRCMSKLGPRRAIILQEDGCSPPSNLDGLGTIPFPAGEIHVVFAQVRAVLRREGLA